MKKLVLKAKLLTPLSIRLKKSKLSYYPYKITIDPGNICNLGCALCPSGTHSLKVPKGFMKVDVMKRIIDELGAYLEIVSLYNWGEPLLHPDILELIEIINSSDIKVRISTNLMDLTPDIAKGLAKSNLRKVFISCDGASQKTYKRYHTKGDFNIVMDNMRLLLDERKNANSSWDVVWLFHVFHHNEHELEKASEISRKMGLKIQFNPMRTDMGREIFETRRQAVDKDGAWIPKNPVYNKFSNPDIQMVRFCSNLWKETTISWNGSVLPCCAVYESDKYNFGNILKQDFESIWNGDAYISAREEVLGRLENSRTVCHICRKSGFLHF